MDFREIEDAFKRFTAPSLELRIGHDRLPVVKGGELRLRFRLENVGTVTAELPFLRVRVAGTAVGGWPPRPAPTDPRQSGTDKDKSFWGSADFVIHPGQEREIEYMAFAVESSGDAIEKVGQVPIADSFVRFEYSIAAKQMRLAEGTRTISFMELLG